MLEKVIDFVEKHHMLQQQDNIVVGVSGGPDSICLLFVLKELQSKYNVTLHAVHVNHMLRGKESDEDEAFTRKFCESLGIPCKVFRFPIEELAKEQKASTEEMGRQVRYETFANILEEMGGGKIAVAHHMDDRAETMLLNLFRGTGLNGLASIRPVRGNIIRPLLGVTSKEIEHYLQEQKIPYVLDSTNAQDDYTRNKIRHHVLSYVNREINSSAVQAMNKTATQLEKMEAYFQKTARELINTYGESDGDEVRFSLEGFKKQEPLIQSYVVMECIRQCSHPLKDVTHHHIEECCRLSKKKVGKVLALPRGLCVKKEYEALRFFKEDQRTEKKFELEEIVLFTKKTYDKREKIPNSAYTKWFDYDKIKSQLELRTRKPGDYIVVNEQGGTKKLKDYFIDEKIPREQRDRVPLLAEGSHVLWVLGYRMSEAYKVTENTNNLLVVTRKNRKGTEDE